MFQNIPLTNIKNYADFKAKRHDYYAGIEFESGSSFVALFVCLVVCVSRVSIIDKRFKPGTPKLILN